MKVGAGNIRREKGKGWLQVSSGPSGIPRLGSPDSVPYLLVSSGPSGIPRLGSPDSVSCLWFWGHQVGGESCGGVDGAGGLAGGFWLGSTLWMDGGWWEALATVAGFQLSDEHMRGISVCLILASQWVAG